jgi:pimeloyl-ACP methyl ester carboxylesterase
MPNLEVNGARIYFEEHGIGPETIIFAHSLLFNCRMFDDQVNALKDRYRCITYDFRGQGHSEVTRDGYDIDSLYEDTVAIIEQLDCAPCHFLGFSMGGMVALRIAIRRPELLKSLILVDTSADPEPSENLPKYNLLKLFVRWIGPWAVTGQIMPIMFGQKFLTDPARADLVEKWRGQFTQNDRIGVTRAVTAVITREAVYDQIDTIMTPSLIIVGEKDVGITPDKSERMHERIPNSKMVTIPDAGHMTPVEEPDAVITALKDFLAP